MRFLPVALFLLSAVPSFSLAQESCACGEACVCRHETAAVLKARERIRNALANFYSAYFHGQNVDMNEYQALVAEGAAYGIDIDKLPALLPRGPALHN